jgi:hypothetical protein
MKQGKFNTQGQLELTKNQAAIIELILLGNDTSAKIAPLIGKGKSKGTVNGILNRLADLEAVKVNKTKKSWTYMVICKSYTVSRRCGNSKKSGLSADYSACDALSFRSVGVAL